MQHRPAVSSVSVGNSLQEAAGSVAVSAGVTSDAAKGGNVLLTGGRGASGGAVGVAWAARQILKMVEQLQ